MHKFSSAIRGHVKGDDTTDGPNGHLDHSDTMITIAGAADNLGAAAAGHVAPD